MLVTDTVFTWWRQLQVTLLFWILLYLETAIDVSQFSPDGMYYLILVLHIVLLSFFFPQHFDFNSFLWISILLGFQGV